MEKIQWSDFEKVQIGPFIYVVLTTGFILGDEVVLV